MNQTLDIKYRPKTFEEVIGQDHAISQLQGTPDKVYILHGPSGIGKTTLARIFAEKINGELTEIDSTSIGKAEVTTLTDRAYTKSMFKDYTVVLLDEVHELSKQAMNALLKTLEDGPAHTVWIMCTTEGHKIIDTLKKRAQNIYLDKVPTNLIADHIKQVSDLEGIDIPEEDIQEIAKYVDGSVRPALKLLEAYQKTGVLNLPINTEIAIELTKSVYEKDMKNVNKIIMDFSQHDIHQYIIFLSDYIMALLILEQEVFNGGNPQELFPQILEKCTNISPALIDKLRDMQRSIQSRTQLPNSPTAQEIAGMLTHLLQLIMSGYNMFGDNRYQLKALVATYASGLR